MHNFDEARGEYISLLDQQNRYWKQRAKAFWLKGGDANTCYFHNVVNKGRRINKIQKLKDPNGIWVHEREDMHRLMFRYFDDIFTSNDVSLSHVHAP